MNCSIAIVATLCCLSLGVSAVAEETRAWTDSSGKHKIQAEFVSFDGKIVTLRRAGTGKKVAIAMERLSDEDQVYVDDLMREREAKGESGTTEPKVGAEPNRSPGDSNLSASSARPGLPSGRRAPNNVINSVRGAVYRVETQNNMRQIAIAIQAYQASRGSFPTAAIQTRDGRPGLSWRVAILPMLEMDGLYRQFKLDEPWDSDHNKALIPQMPSIYRSPGSDLDEGYTNYLAVASPDSIITDGTKGTRSNEVRDGLSRTVMFVEVDDTYAAIWTQPSDYEWDSTKPAYGLGGIWAGQFMVGYGDGSIERLDASLDADQINGLFTRSGGELIR